jgi:S1-C subfamily serine protease
MLFRRLVAVLLFISLICSVGFSQTKSESLSNDDVIQMVSMGLSNDVIIEKVRTAPATEFDTSIGALKSLKDANVPDIVIKSMMSPHPVVSQPSGRVMDELATKFQTLKNGVFTVWSELGHGTGFLISSDGLVLTNQHVVGTSEYIALQFDPRVKIPAVVLAADPQKDVAVLWADVSAIRDTEVLVIAKPVAAGPTLMEGERVFTIGSPLNQQKVITSGIASKIETTAIISDVNINHGNSGGPLFNSQGQVVGITTFGDFTSQGGPGISGILRIEEAEAVIANARAKMASINRPEGKLLPVEPEDLYPIEAIKGVLSQKKFDEKPYRIDDDDFDVTLITPPLKYYLEHEASVRAANEKNKRNRKSETAVQNSFRPLDDLKNWEQYVGEYKPILFIRVTPKLRETTGSIFMRSLVSPAVPAKLRFKTDFYKMKLLCGSKEIAPIMPGKIAHVVSVNSGLVNATDATYEGLYAFPADAIGPSCHQVTLQVYSEKKPNVAVATILEEKTVNRVWDDFQPYRAQH